MAKIHTLTYNGTKSSDLGVFVTGSGSFDAAELDVDKYEIPGRNGDLILSNNRYKNIEITYPAFIPKAFMDKAQNVRNWLRSSKVYARLEDTYDTDHYRLGIPTGVQSFEPVNRNDGANFEITFDCKPQRFLKAGETPDTVEADVQTESGEIVTFETIAESPMTSAEVSLSPIQDLNGYDSPWPAGGGKNILPTTIDDMKTYLTAGTWNGNVYTYNDIVCTVSTNNDGYLTGVSISGKAARTFGIKVYLGNLPDTLAAGESYIVSWGGSIPYFQLISYNASNATTVLINDKTANTATITIPSDCVRLEMRAYLIQGNTYNQTITPMIRLASVTDSTFSPYSNICPIYGHTGAELKIGSAYPTAVNTYSVTFSNQGTVYGGTYDFVTGKLVVEWVNIDSYNGETITEPWLSSMDVYSAGATPTTGAQVVYKLASPIEYTLSAQQIETLLGENNVWSDAGPITLTYAEPYTIENPTQFEARPLFIITNPNQGDALSVSGKTITFVDSYTGTVTIDCETMDCYAGFDNMNYLIEATDFPVLGEGTSIVTWSGSGECKMIPRWWEL